MVQNLYDYGINNFLDARDLALRVSNKRRLNKSRLEIHVSEEFEAIFKHGARNQNR